MRLKKTVLLFEVALVVLLVSLASLSLFRGYSVFLKVGRRSSDYIKLALLSEEKMWDLQLKEKNDEITEGMEKEGSFDSYFSWQLELKDSGFSDLKEGSLKINYEQRKESFDTVIYFFTKEEE